MSDETIDQELDKDKIITCEICNEYQGTLQQLKGHTGYCRKKQAEALEATEESLKNSDPESVVSRNQEPRGRRERIPFGVPRKKLHAPEDDGYHYRVFNDNWHSPGMQGRIQRALDAGYDKVESWEPITVGSNEDGSAIKGILMRIPEEWYNEDQALKQKEVDKTDDQIMAGTIEAKAGDERYTPAGIRIHSDNREPNT